MIKSPDLKKNIYIDVGGIPKSPIYFQPWWLDIVCKNGDWEVSIYLNKENKIIGVLPYYYSKFLGFKIIRTPPFTPTLGVWLNYSNCSKRTTSIYSFEMETIKALVNQLPDVISYHQIHPCQFQNWLPFFWKGYQQTTRYTYVLEKLDVEKIYSEMKDQVRNKIRKAKKSGIVVKQENDLTKFTLLLKKTFQRQQIPFDLDLLMLTHLHEEISRRKCGTIYIAEDMQGRAHAAIYMIWDEITAYCWLSGSDTQLRKSGAMQLIIWQSIIDASKIVQNYNFEGSMLPQIEPVFRAFGGKRKQIFQIRKFRNPAFKGLWWLFQGRSL